MIDSLDQIIARGSSRNHAMIAARIRTFDPWMAE